MVALSDVVVALKNARTALLVTAYIALYYVTSAGSGVWSKALVDGASVPPSVLTMLQLAVSLASDAAILRHDTSNEPPTPSNADTSKRRRGWSRMWDIVVCFTPIAGFIIASKITTFLSYQHLSLALSHTAKASEPIFNAAAAALVYREWHHHTVYLTLVPIAMGITLASVTDLSYNHRGFMWAILSALCKVLQNIYIKRLMQSKKFTFWELHYYCGSASLLMLVPVLVWQASAGLQASLAGGHWRIVSVIQFLFAMPVMSLLGCSLLQYASSIVSYRILELVSHLTFTIVNVAKRLVLIVAGMLAAQRAPSITSSIGILMAVGGILAYNIVKDVDPKHGPPQLASLMSWVTWLRELVMQYNRVPHPEEEAPLQPSQSLLPMRAFANALSTSGYQPPGLHIRPPAGGGSGGMQAAEAHSYASGYSGSAGYVSGSAFTTALSSVLSPASLSPSASVVLVASPSSGGYTPTHRPALPASSVAGVTRAVSAADALAVEGWQRPASGALPPRAPRASAQTPAQRAPESFSRPASHAESPNASVLSRYGDAAVNGALHSSGASSEWSWLVSGPRSHTLALHSASGGGGGGNSSPAAPATPTAALNPALPVSHVTAEETARPTDSLLVASSTPRCTAASAPAAGAQLHTR